MHAENWAAYKARRTTQPKPSGRMPEPPAPKRRGRVSAGVRRDPSDTWPGKP